MSFVTLKSTSCVGKTHFVNNISDRDELEFQSVLWLLGTLFEFCSMLCLDRDEVGLSIGSGLIV